MSEQLFFDIRCEMLPGKMRDAFFPQMDLFDYFGAIG